MTTKTKTHEPAWRNRIVGYDTLDPTDLLANPNNWRIHPKTQQDALSEVLETVGWVDDVIVNQRTKFVLDGHLRVALALRKGETSVPVKLVDLSEEEEALVLATLDPIASMAVTDTEKLNGLLSTISVDEQSVLTELLDKLRGKPLDMDKLYAGMPQFDGENLLRDLPHVIVRFPDKKAMTKFAKLTGLAINETTRTVWYPKVPKEFAEDFET